MSIDTEHRILRIIQMVAEDNLDMRTVTMGLSLPDCVDSDVAQACAHIEERIVGATTWLVAVTDEVAAEFRVPVINKRISMTPISLVAAACQADNLLPFAQALDRASQVVGVGFVGGCSALIEAGATRSDQALIDSTPEAPASTDVMCPSMSIGPTRAGINMSAVAHMGEIVRTTAGVAATTDGPGTAKLVVLANAVSDSPFMAGAFHGVNQPNTVVPVGISGPGVVERALHEMCGMTFRQHAETIKRSAFKVTRMGRLVGCTVAERLGVPFGIVDLSLAPTTEIGDSVTAVLEELGVESVGAPGTAAALSLLNDTVKEGRLMVCSLVEGLSGSFIPVSEGIDMIHGVQRGSISLPKLEAITAICSIGLDMIAIPDDTPAVSITGLIVDETAIRASTGKTAVVRVIPVPDKGVGESANFGELPG